MTRSVPDPIVVRNSAAGDLAWNAVRSAIVMASTATAATLWHNDIVTGNAAGFGAALAAAIPAAVAFGVGMVKTLRAHHERKALASLPQVPDSIAKVV